MTKKIIEKHYRQDRSKSVRASGRRSYKTSKEIWESGAAGKKFIAIIVASTILGLSLFLFLPQILEHPIIAITMYVVLVAVAIGRRKKKSWEEIKGDWRNLKQTIKEE